MDEVTLSSDSALHGTLVVAACGYGLRFEDHTTERALICQEDGLWNDTIAECYGKREKDNILVIIQELYVS